MCIEQFLVKSEKKWFEDYKSVKLGLGSSSRNASKISLSVDRPPSPAPAHPRTSRFLDVPTRPHSPYTPSVVSSLYSEEDEDRQETTTAHPQVSSFDPPDSPMPAQILTSPLQRFMLRKLFDWPVYTIILALGQILGANSYQISLLNGEQGQTASMLYTIASIYAGSSVLWWIAFRRFPSVWVLSTPFAVYGSAFIFAGCAPFASSIYARGWLQKTASGLYAAASSSGSMYFALNFGDEGTCSPVIPVIATRTDFLKVVHLFGHGLFALALCKAYSKFISADSGIGDHFSLHTTAMAFRQHGHPTL